MDDWYGSWKSVGVGISDSGGDVDCGWMRYLLFCGVRRRKMRCAKLAITIELG
jgi:hypothetical protein